MLNIIQNKTQTTVATKLTFFGDKISYFVQKPKQL